MEPTSLTPYAQARRRRRRQGQIALAVAALVLAALAALWVRRQLAELGNASSPVPTASVQRGDVEIAVVADATVSGAHSEVLVAPMVGGGDLHLSTLMASGSAVHPGDVVAQFDTTQQEYNLKEAKADLAEARQQVVQAQADAAAQQDDDQFALTNAQDAVRLAELDVRRNPILAAIDAKKNNLALEGAREHLRQLQNDLASSQLNSRSNIEMQQATEARAQVAARMAQSNIEMMSLKAKSAGYVSIRPNSSTNFAFGGMRLPDFQLGDTANPGAAIAEIPDTNGYVLDASIGELDRGHLRPGQPATITFPGLPGAVYPGHLQYLGGMVGPPWDRHSDCAIALDAIPPGLHPGMSARARVVTSKFTDVLWVPAQAVFEANGRTFVYVPQGRGFVTHDVKVVQRSESQVVISGLAAGQRVALANPTAGTKTAAAAAPAARPGKRGAR